MSNNLDAFVTKLIETGSTGSDNPDYTSPMYKRTPGKWSWKYLPDKGKAIVSDNEFVPENFIPTNGDMQLMSYSAEMNSMLWILANKGIYRKAIIYLLAKINVAPDPDLHIPEHLIEEVKSSRNAGA